MKRWTFLAAVVAGALIWWAGCTNPNLAGGKLHFDQASRLEGSDRTARFRRALETFKAAEAQMPQSGEVRLWLGKTYAELDMPDSAGVMFDQAESLNPEMKKDIADVRDHYWSVKYNAGVSAAVAAAKSRHDGNETAAKASFRDALRQFNKAALYSPGHPNTYTNIGKVYLNLSAVDSAITMLQEARKKAPDDTKVRDDLFAVYRTEADTAYQRASSKLDASDSTGARGLFGEAQKLYRQAEETSPGHSDISFQLGMTSYELAQLDPEHRQDLMAESVGHYQDVLKDNSADVDVLYNLSLALRDLGRYQEAREYTERLVDLKPEEGSYRQMLGRVADKLGDKQALLSGIIFGTALKSGTKVDTTQAEAMAKKFGGSSDLLRRYRENGPPNEILTFTDTQGQEYEVWFYWHRGDGFGFVEGKERFQSQFAPVGVLTLTKSALTTKGTGKEVTGTILNESNRKYTYVRVVFTLLDDSDQDLGRVSAGTETMGPRGAWSFEIPLDKNEEQATKIRLEDTLGY